MQIEEENRKKIVLYGLDPTGYAIRKIEMSYDKFPLDETKMLRCRLLLQIGDHQYFINSNTGEIIKEVEYHEIVMNDYYEKFYGKNL